MAISRSENMRRIRSKNTIPELVVRKLLRELGLTGYRLHRKEIAGKPDLAWIGRKKIIFIHGCFWHGHDCKEGIRKPKSNTNYWSNKIDENIRRDTRHISSLISCGWAVLVIWECETRDKELLVTKLRNYLSSN